MKHFTMTVLVAANLFLAREIISPENCGECHVDIYEDWKTSRHANSTASTNPLFASLYQKSIKDTEGGTRYFCIRCHAPLSAINGDRDLEKLETNRGVTCQVCHTAIKLSMHPESWPLEYGKTGTVYTSGESRSDDAHNIIHSDLFVSGNVCSTCHGEMIDIPGLTSCSGLPICNQMAEWSASDINKKCIDCHMPENNSHSFAGAYTPSYLAKALEIDSKWKIFFGELVIDLTVTNKGTGHRFPSGPPSRAGILKLTAKDSDGNVVWSNFSENPVAEDPFGVFHVVLGTNENLLPAMPWNAKRVLKDTRLDQSESRQFTYKFPAKNVSVVDIKVLYRFAPVMMLDNFMITDQQLRKSHIVSSTVLEIK